MESRWWEWLRDLVVILFLTALLGAVGAYGLLYALAERECVNRDSGYPQVFHNLSPDDDRAPSGE